MRCLTSLVAVAFVFFIVIANAEQKRDIRGFHTGMSKADFFKNVQAQMTGCKVRGYNRPTRTDAPPETASNIQISCPDKTEFNASFTRDLNPNVLAELGYTFDPRGKTYDGLVADVTQQFGIKEKGKDGPVLSKTYDLGGGTELKLLYLGGNYLLSIRSDKIYAQDRKADEDKTNRSAPTIKF